MSEQKKGGQPEPRKPRVGDVVEFYGGRVGQLYPLAAVVAHVRPDGKVNLGFWDEGGNPGSRLGVEFAAEPALGRWGWRKRD